MRGASSAPTSRVVDVMELLARPGAEELRYSDIARELNLPLATAHTILKTLCDRGWVSRDPVDKTFTLGPGIAFLAEAVLARPLAQTARAAAVGLAAEFGFPASVTEKAGDLLVITAFEGGDSPWPGDRIPYAPPFGAGFAAWADEDERRAWIQRAAFADAASALRLEEALERTRARGFDVDCTSPALARAAELFDTVDSDPMSLPPNIRGMLDQLRREFSTVGFAEDDPDGQARPVATIAAPVSDTANRVAMLLAVHPLNELPPRQIEAIGQHLLRTTAALGVGI